MTRPTEKIGLLFVHGIGEQKPFEHLKSSVSELAELLARGSDTSFVSCAVEDRTADWTLPVGAPTANGDAPITLRVNVVPRKGAGDAARRQYEFHCHEVYWADLGARSGLLDVLKFWIWGLGQWAAPIYRDLDAAQVKQVAKPAADGKTMTFGSHLTAMPASVAGELWSELGARLKLWIAGVGALFTLVTLSLVKRVAAGLTQSAPSPTLLVQYIGDVRTYEERAQPGDSTLSDPGFPRRVAIRRRMVTQMVGMGARTDLHGWYVLGHSLGSVVAYNGLTEIGHALPNYLGKDQWNALPPHLKRDPQCPRREGEEHLMMPARADWLHDEDVIDRKALFARLRGVVTYGSPLNKFAGLWPRIVATATRRLDGTSVFPEGSCRWLNLQAPQDPVAGTLDRFGATRVEDGGAKRVMSRKFKTAPFEGDVPPCTTYRTPIWQPYLLAHLNYFQNTQSYKHGVGITQRTQVAQWLIGENPGLDIATVRLPVWFGKLAAALAVLILTASLATAAVALVTVGGGLGKQLIFPTPGAKPSSTDFFATFLASVWPILAIVAGAILLAGLLRWSTGAWYDWRMARHQNDNRGRDAPGMTIEKDWTPVVRLEAAQWLASTLSVVLTVAGFAAWWIGCRPTCLDPLHCPWLEAHPVAALVCLELLLVLLAAALQAVVNCLPVSTKGVAAAP